MGRPFARQRAAYAPPAPVLSIEERSFLSRIERDERLHVGRDMPLSVAIRLSAIGFILISGGRATAINPAEIPY